MPIPPVTEFAGQLPAENDPATFPARAEALFDWLVGQGMPTFNAAIAAVNVALNDNGTVLDTAGRAIALTTNANTIVGTAGTGNAYTIAPAVAVAAYEAGQTFMLRPDRQNTGAVTLKVGALAAAPVRKIAASGSGFVELAAGDWRPGEIHIVTYNGTQFELLTVPLNGFVRTDQAQTITGNWNFAGGLAFADAPQVRGALGLSALATASAVGTSQIGDAAVNFNKLSADQRMTTANVQANAAAAALDQVGTDAFLARAVAGGSIVAGALYAASELRFAGISGGSGSSTSLFFSAIESFPTGTWRAMGNIVGFSTHWPACVFRKVAG